jgi:hypothetical protein
MDQTDLKYISAKEEGTFDWYHTNDNDINRIIKYIYNAINVTPEGWSFMKTYSNHVINGFYYKKHQMIDNIRDNIDISDDVYIYDYLYILDDGHTFTNVMEIMESIATKGWNEWVKSVTLPSIK